MPSPALAFLGRCPSLSSSLLLPRRILLIISIVPPFGAQFKLCFFYRNFRKLTSQLPPAPR